ILWPHFWSVVANYGGIDPELIAARQQPMALVRGEPAKPTESARESRRGWTFYPPSTPTPAWNESWQTAGDVLNFLAECLKVQLREQGTRHDLVDAVFALGDQDEILLIVRRVEALGRFLDTDDGKNLLAGTKRAANILREEEKKAGAAFDGDVDPRLLTEPEEKALFEAIGAAEGEARAAVAVEDFDGAIRALA